MLPIAEWQKGVVHGVIGHHGKKEEEVEEELGQEVKGQKEEEKSNTSAHVHGWDGSDETRTRP